MTTFTDDQARRQLAAVLRTARSQGEARIRTPDGQEYTVRPVEPAGSPFAIAGVDLGLCGRRLWNSCAKGGRDRPVPLPAKNAAIQTDNEPSRAI